MSKKQKLCPIMYSNVPKKSTGTLIHFDKKITYHAFIRNTAFINFQKLSTHHAYYEHKSMLMFVIASGFQICTLKAVRQENWTELFSTTA